MDQGVCPAATERRLHGTHSGKNAGRACWVVAGTLCNGMAQGVFAVKFGECARCRFYRQVSADEAPNFIFAPALLKKLSW